MNIRKEYVLGGLVISLSLVLMLFFYWKSGAIDDTREHQHYVESIRHLQASDAILDQHLLRLRMGALTSVDLVNAELSEIHRLDAILEHPPKYIPEQGQVQLLAILNSYHEVMRRKELLIERFKAENANLKTSIIYYPVISQELIDRLAGSEQSERLIKQVQDLLRDTLLFNLNTSGNLEENIKSGIDQLGSDSATFTNRIEGAEWNPREEFEDLSTQVNTILRVKPGVDTLINDLMEMPVAIELENLANTYHDWYNYALSQAMFYRFCLYLNATLMIIFLAWLIIRNLDQRIKNATLSIAEQRDQLARKLDEREALSAVAVAVSTIGDVDIVLDTILEKSREVMNAEASSLLLLSDDETSLYFHGVRGSVSETLKNQRIQVGQGIVGHVAKSGKTEAISDPYSDPRFNKAMDVASGFVTRSLLTAPLTNKNKIIGVLQLVNRKELDHFDEYDISLVESFAAHAGVAIENSRLYTGINNHAADLKVSLENERRLTIEKEKMGAYVPRQVIDEISRNREEKLALGGKVIRATVLFSDIVGFTRLSEILEPKIIVDFLNKYMTEMANIIEEEGGIIDKFIGDGIMAVFASDDEEQALGAVRSGLRMQAIVKEHRASWGEISVELANVSMRVGINTGRVISGNIGSERRMDYTVIGDNVNIAARIEGASVPGGILVSSSTFDEVRYKVRAGEMVPITVKNRNQAIHSYAIDVDQPLPERELET